MQQLIRYGREELRHGRVAAAQDYFKRAADLYDTHNRMRGCPKMRWGARWFADYNDDRSILQ